MTAFVLFWGAVGIAWHLGWDAGYEDRRQLDARMKEVDDILRKQGKR